MDIRVKTLGIKYGPRTTIKWQVLTDFLAKFTPGTLAQSDLLEGWVLNVDGASNSKGWLSESSSPLRKGPLSSNPSLSASLP